MRRGTGILFLLCILFVIAIVEPPYSYRSNADVDWNRVARFNRTVSKDNRYEQIDKVCRADGTRTKKSRATAIWKLRTARYYRNEALLTSQKLSSKAKRVIGMKFINAAKLDNLKEGKAVRLRVKVISTEKENEDVLLYSSNEKVATVDSSGIVIAKKPGLATITAQAADGSGKNIKYRFKVVKPVESIAFSGEEQEIRINLGESGQIETKILPEDASIKTLQWQSEDETIASVQDGLITALATGTTTIRAKATDGSGVEQSITVHVVKNIESVAIRISDESAFYSKEEDGSIFVKKGVALSIGVRVKPEDATNQNVVWSSSDPDVAVVSENGMLCAKNCGDATITAVSEDTGAVSDTIQVTVAKIPKDNSRLVAHRGSSDLAPENSMAAIEQAMQSGVKDVEFDVWETLDHQFVVSHDESLKASCNIDSKVTEMTLEQAMECRISNGNHLDQYSDEYIPSLEQVLKMASDYSGNILHIELKEDFNKKMLKKLLTMISDYGLQDRVKIITFSKKDIARIRKLTELGGDQIPLEYLCNTVDADSLKVCKTYQTDIGVNYSNLTKKQVEKCHKKGIAVNAWTVDDFKTAYDLVTQWQVDAITSDYIMMD